jgi:hypothetical protein
MAADNPIYDLEMFLENFLSVLAPLGHIGAPPSALLEPLDAYSDKTHHWKY